MPFLGFLVCALTLGQAKAPITALAICPNGDAVLAGSQSGLRVLSWADLRETRQVATSLSHVTAIAFAPDAQKLLVAGGAPAERGVVEVLSWPGLEKILTLHGHPDLVLAVAWSPDSRFFATAGADGTCTVHGWQGGKAASQSLRYTGHSRPVQAITFLPDGKLVVSAGVDQSLQLWNATTGKLERSLDNHLRAVNDLAIQPTAVQGSNPAMVASVSEDRTLRLWQPTIGRLVRFARLTTVPRTVVWSKTGDHLLAGCNDGSVLQLAPDSPDLTPIRTIHTKLGRIHALAIHLPGGQLLAGGEKGVAKVPLP